MSFAVNFRPIMLSIPKTLSFVLVAEALTGLIYHRPAGKNSSFISMKMPQKAIENFEIFFRIKIFNVTFVLPKIFEHWMCILY